MSTVIDAKYKTLENEGKLNREDIYQVTSYMYRLKSKKGVLLFHQDQIPWNIIICIKIV
ncbi:MAG: hypothetical protein IPH88_15620 [Bacteroidales bacterium]|nr:hypothetical protein [Bacteroidales bacterium]